MHTFSIVTAVYNVEPYLAECIESVLHQDYDLARVQLILVDDGSTDGSGALCDAWAAKYPDTITVIHKENGGVSSARNEGLNHVRGEYVNFLDADDKLASNALREADQFFTAHEEVDLASMPVYFFGRQTGQHILNDKYRRGTRVIDLEEEFDAIHVQAASTFIKFSAMKNLQFDVRQKYAEDSKFCLQVLRNKKKLGVIAGTRYYYRKRENNQSAVDKQNYSYEAYGPTMDLYIFDVLNSFQGNAIPKFIQYALLYEINWRMKIERSRLHGVLSDTDYDEYKRKVLRSLDFFDDDVLSAFRFLFVQHKIFLLTQKHHSKLQIQWDEDIGKCYVGDTLVCTLNSRPVYLEFLKTENKQVIIEGCITYFPDLKEAGIQIAAVVNHRLILAETNDIRQKKSEMLGENCLYTINFRLTIPESTLGKETRISFVTLIEGHTVCHKNIRLEKFFPIGFANGCAYSVTEDYFVEVSQGELAFTRVCFIEHICKEVKYLVWLWRSRKRGARKAVAVRLLYYALKPFMNRHTWLISDRVNKADDNGEAFFKYLHDIGSRQKRYFVIRGDSPDYEKVRQYGPVLRHYSLRHRMTHLFAEAILSSAGEDDVFCPFWNNAFYRDLLYGQKKIFLQHGITKDDISSWLNRYNKNLDIFVTAAKPEYESILRGQYFYDKSVVKLTGFARYDRLYDRKERIITIMPTWRQYLMNRDNYSRTGTADYEEAFWHTPYFQFYNGLINDERLLSAAEKWGYTVQFMPHPMVIPYIDRFTHNDRVRFCHIDTAYREVFAESSLVVTDYSSVAFDFAYLRKPVLYAQFDKDTFFEKHHVYEPGYFDYERDGFGEVSYDLDTLVDRIIGYMEAGCPLKDAYRERIDRFFAFHDRNNCRRIHEAIRSVLGRKS